MRRLILVLAAVLAGLAAFFVTLLAPVQRREPYQRTFIVMPGESVQEISASLETAGLIRERRAFTLLAVLRGRAGDLKAGPYRASSDLWAWEILDELVAGAVEDTAVTVPEGLWLTEVAGRLGPWVAGGAEAFRAAATDSAFIRGLGVPGPTAEGYLFPDTYRIIPGSPARSAVREMVETFLRHWRKELAGRAAERGLTMRQVATLASIVEAEAQVPAERPRIAAVYLNRLDRGLPLQADPTVQYALGERRGRTLLADLETESPYNTYRRTGLPPGPIGNPGLESLRAVLWPEPDCRDLYFVAKGDGTHLFAPDFQGHRRNRAQARRWQRAHEAAAAAAAEDPR